MKKQDNKQWELTAKFITKTYCDGKLVKESTRDSEKYVFYGDTKKECIEKAKKAGRYGNFYTKNFNIMAKINKLFVNYQHFGAIQKGVYLTTFGSETKRSLQSDSTGFFFIMNKEKQRITNEAEIERIKQFLNIK